MTCKRSVTATVYIVNNGRVLLHRHLKYHTWFPVGGHTEPGEFPHETALREAMEEAGLRVRLLSTEIAPPIDLGLVDRLPAPFCLMREGIGSSEEFFDFIYIAAADGAELRPAAGESRELRWFGRAELLAEDLKPHIRNTALAALDFAETVSEKDGTK